VVMYFSRPAPCQGLNVVLELVEAEAIRAQRRGSSQGRESQKRMVSPPEDDFTGGGAHQVTYPRPRWAMAEPMLAPRRWSRTQEGEALGLRRLGIGGGRRTRRE